MSTQILANIGNTNSEFAILEQGKLTPLLKVPTSKLFDSNNLPEVLKPYFPMPLVAASVVPKATNCLKKCWTHSHWIAAEDTTLLDFSEVDVATLGADRVANAIAIKSYGLPAIVIDCGTAITTEVVDAHGKFVGGAILPGRMLSRRALGEHTGQLPLIPLTETLPEALGKNTVEALSAVDLAMVGGLEKLLAETRQLLGTPNCPAYVTGGDAAFFKKTIPELHELPPTFTIFGIKSVAQSIHPQSTEC